MHGVYDQIAFTRQYEIDTMQQMRLLHKTFSKELSFIHKARLNSLMSTCVTASTSNQVFLTGLGRNAVSKTRTSSNIEKVNRLLGNKTVFRERSAFYATMAAQLIPRWMSPWIHIDWSCINSTTNLYLLRDKPRTSATGRSNVNSP